MPQIASKILMVRPASFGYNEETAANNVFQSLPGALSKDAVQKKAVAEFDAFVETLHQHKIDVVVFQDTAAPQKPDAIFPNNWFASFENGKVFIFPMYAPNRRIEKSSGLIDLLENKFVVKELEDWSSFESINLFLEGTGSMIFDHKNKIVYACLSPRTDPLLLDKFARENGYKPVSFFSKDENGVDVYHTNVIMHLGENYAVICLDSITDLEERKMVQKSLETTGNEIINISLNQVHQYAGNMLQLKSSEGQKFTILSQSAFNALTKAQIEIFNKYTNLLPINIDTIETIGGGSVRCMMAEIFLNHK